MPAHKMTLDEAREKYRIEREKRLRPDGIAQYPDLSGKYADFDTDPYTAPFERGAIVEDLDTVIVGAGFGGMLAAANLRKAGESSFRIIDKAGDFGGTWYWNRYPGCMCDVESYVYLPMLEETGYMPTQKYAQAYEIFDYCRLLGRTFDLYPTALFQTEIETCTWNEPSHRWVVTTNRGDTLRAKFVVIAGGVLNKAKLPGIPGIENFQGKSFHTSRWDYKYTGGGPAEFMANLADKRVAIVGTGATAVQVVPRLAESAKELYVFQRTPSNVGVRNQQSTDEEWFKSLEPGWQRERIINFTDSVCGKQPEVDMVHDAWTDIFWVDTKKKPESPEEALELETVDFENMEKIRQRILDTVEDPETAEKLLPWYQQGCKRPCFHDEYLPAFNRPNVHLVDTDGKGVDRITEHGLVVGDTEYPVDVIVYASGYEVTTEYSHRLGFDPVGEGGVSLGKSWHEGPHTLHGVTTNGFPNLLMISTVQGGFGVNFVHYLTETSAHVAYIIDRCLRDGITEIEPTADAEEGWFNELLKHIDGVANYNMTCTPGYLNAEGGGDMASLRATPFMGSVGDYAAHLIAWRDEGALAGLEVTKTG